MTTIASLILSLATFGQPHAQPTITYPAGIVQINVPAPFSVENGPDYIKIKWGSPQPAPPPAPPLPTPDPDPVVIQPTTQNPLWVVAVINKSAQLPPGHAELRDSKTVAAKLKDLNAQWRCYDVNDPLLAQWASDVGTPPSLLVIELKNGSAAKFSSGPLPAGESAVMAEIKKIRGKL